jgi:hypothetical protein
MLAFMNRVDGRLKQIETQVNKIDEVKSSLVDITRKVSSLNITVKELKESLLIFFVKQLYSPTHTGPQYFHLTPRCALKE